MLRSPTPRRSPAPGCCRSCSVADGLSLSERNEDVELFSTRADDLEVELLVEPSTRFTELLLTHGADVAIGPKSSELPVGIVGAELLRYDFVAVVAADVAPTGAATADWYLGPSAVEPSGVSQFVLQRAGIDETRQRIYASHAAALEAARRD